MLFLAAISSSGMQSWPESSRQVRCTDMLYCPAIQSYGFSAKSSAVRIPFWSSDARNRRPMPHTSLIGVIDRAFFNCSSESMTQHRLYPGYCLAKWTAIFARVLVRAIPMLTGIPVPFNMRRERFSPHTLAESRVCRLNTQNASSIEYRKNAGAFFRMRLITRAVMSAYSS